MRLLHDFYKRNTVDVARDLIGKNLVFGSHKGIITETEAYRGKDDEASHAYKGSSGRSSIMFGAPGYLYVYMIYGMYHCINVVTEEEGSAGAVLIRGLMLDDMHLDGPGKVCRYLDITRRDNGINLISSDTFYLTQGIDVEKVEVTSRIGIKKARDKLWRFVGNITKV